VNIKFFITLFALLNPIGILPVFIGLAQRLDDKDVEPAIRMAAITVFCAIAVSVVCGMKILSVFGISLGAFQISGGLILLLIGLKMLFGQKQAQASANTLLQPTIGVVPVGVPLLVGPGVISAVIVHAHQNPAWQGQLELVLQGLLLGLVVYVIFRLAGPIHRVLGATGIDILTQIMGLLISALALEIMTSGLLAIFPAWAGTVKSL
jgi:multiple antibiotic resistance protein